VTLKGKFQTVKSTNSYNSLHTLLARYGYKPPCLFSDIEPKTELMLITAAFDVLSDSDDLF
jgi:hypothetical protein